MWMRMGEGGGCKCMWMRMGEAGGVHMHVDENG